MSPYLIVMTTEQKTWHKENSYYYDKPLQHYIDLIKSESQEFSNNNPEEEFKSIIQELCKKHQVE